MTNLITFLLLIAWFFLLLYCPQMLCGYSYPQLTEIMQNEDAQAITDFAKALGLTEENSTQVASKFFYTSIAIIIGVLILILIIRKALILLEQYIDRKNALANALNKQKINEALSNQENTVEKNTSITTPNLTSQESKVVKNTNSTQKK